MASVSKKSYPLSPGRIGVAYHTIEVNIDSVSRFVYGIDLCVDNSCNGVIHFYF